LLATTRKLRSFPLCGNSKIFIPYTICFCFLSTLFSFKIPGFVTDYNFFHFVTRGRIAIDVISQVLIISSTTLELDPSVTFCNLCYPRLHALNYNYLPRVSNIVHQGPLAFRKDLVS
jgi:hypothetical protein